MLASPYDKRILELLAKGKSNKEIATELNRFPGTIYQQIVRMRQHNNILTMFELGMMYAEQRAKTDSIREAIKKDS